MATITAANSVLMLSVGLVYPVPKKIEGFASDDAFLFDDNAPAEALMGVDGRMSAGWIPTMRVQTVSLQADSPSLEMFDTWATSQDVAREVFYAMGTIILPSIGKKYAMTRGVLTRMKTMPDVKKTLQPVTYQITWESALPALV